MTRDAALERPPLPYRRRLRRAAYHGLARAVLAAVRLLPTPAGRRLCRGLARAALAWRPRERDVARANLRLVFPDLAPPAREALLRRAAGALGENAYDALTLDRWRRDGYRDVADDGAVAALRGLLAEGRGALVLTGHFGCWELLGGYLADRLGGLTVVTGTIRNPPVDRLVNGWRRRAGMTPVPRDGDQRPLLRALRAGGAVAVLLDQNTRVGSRDVPFCGVDAPTPAGFARLALRTGTPILPVAIGRRGRGHALTHLPPLRPGAAVGEDAVDGLLREANAALETLLRRNPSEWVWFHRRWPAAGATAQDLD
ncbi:MAG: hypothetical protein IPH09_01055 [bacterium]|nr:hypothetical protein [bacterium]